MDIIHDIIFPVLEEMKKDDENYDYELSESLELYGNNSVFDSLSLLRFIVNIQDKILELTDKDIIIVSSDIMKKSDTPFRTVSSLAHHLQRLLEDEQ